MEKVLQTFPIHDLTPGMDPLAPPRSLQPGQGPLWRSLQNLRGHDGVLKRAEALVPVAPSGAPGPPILFNGSGNEQVPVIVRQFDVNGSDSARTLLVTTREAWLWTGVAWESITPVYTDGTVNLTNGSVTVTAASGTPAWLDRGIVAGQLLQLPNGSWYKLTAVTNTSLTLHTGYTGSTATNQPYTIRRTFVGPVVTDSLASGVAFLFAQIYNGDLYIAAPYGFLDYAVFRVPEIDLVTKVTWPAGSITYLLAGAKQVAAGVDFLGYQLIVYGMHLLEDGRITLGVHWWNQGLNVGGQNRILYSSHLNPAVWTAIPGGFTDLIQRSGELTALHPQPRGISVHFSDGVVVGSMTGQDSPPLDFQGTRAMVGALNPRTLRTTPLGDLFVGYDRHLRVFDGASSRVLRTGLDRELLNHSYSQLAFAAHAELDLYRNEYRLFLPEDSDLEPSTETSRAKQQTTVVSLDLETLFVRRSQYAALLGACTSSVLEGFPGATLATAQRALTTTFVGIPTFANGSVTNTLYRLAETLEVADNHPQTATGSRGGIYAESDDYDFGLTAIDKTISHVTLWYRSKETTGTAQVELGLSRDSGLTFVTVTKTLSFFSTMELFAHFHFEPVAAEAWRVRIRFPDGNSCPLELTRLVMHYAPLHEVEAVER